MADYVSDRVSAIDVAGALIMIYAPTWGFPYWDIHYYSCSETSTGSEWIVPGTLVID